MTHLFFSLSEGFVFAFWYFLLFDACLAVFGIFRAWFAMAESYSGCIRAVGLEVQ
jgi:hypothetical protein